MTIPEKCSHGIRLRGPNPPRCIECEIVWEAQALIDAEQAVARHSGVLARLCAEAGVQHRPASEPAPASAPSEWVSVPREATDEMVNVGRETWDDTQSVDSVWAAMIEAAPASAPSCCGWEEAAKIADQTACQWGLGEEGAAASYAATAIRARAQPCRCGELGAEIERLQGLVDLGTLEAGQDHDLIVSLRAQIAATAPRSGESKP